MGNVGSQSIELHEDVAHFDNLEAGHIEALWRAFTEVAGSFALSVCDVKQICSVLAAPLGDTPAEMNDFACRLFDLFLSHSVSPHVEVIDAMEFFIGLAFTSKMTLEDKANFVFDCFDFDGDGNVDVGEVTLSVKSADAGLAKMRGATPDQEGTIIILAREWFASCLGGIVDEDASITREEFVRYCTDPEHSVYPIFQVYGEAEGAELDDVDSDIEIEGEVSEALLDKLAERDAAEAKAGAGQASELDMESLFLGGSSAGDEFMSIKPWLGAIVAPSGTHTGPQPSAAAPDVELNLAWVHGYRSADCRNNLRYLSDGQHVVYHSAAVGVRHALASPHAGGAQEFQLSHTNDILCLAVCEPQPAQQQQQQQQLVATGEAGRSPCIVVWDAESMEAVTVIQGFHVRGVTHLAFSTPGSSSSSSSSAPLLLVSVGLDSDHSVAVNDARSGRLLQTAKTTKEKVLDLRWNGFLSGGGGGFVTCGVKHVLLWTCAPGGGSRLVKARGSFGRKAKAHTALCASFLRDGGCAVGTLTGGLFVFHGSTAAPPSAPAAAAHRGGVTAMAAVGGRAGGGGEVALVSGGKDASVALWAHSSSSSAPAGLRLLARLDLPSLVLDAGLAPAFQPAVRSVCLAPDGARLLLGTRGSEVYELGWDGAEARVLHDGPLVSGHCKDEVWGLAVHPSRAEFCTVGDDHTLRVWDVEGHRLLRLRDLGGMARAVAYSPDGSLLAVGMGGRVGRGKQKQDGVVLVVRADSLETVHESRDSKQWISDVKFSPDGSLLAVGSHDNTVHFYNVSKGFQRRPAFKKHNSYITHLDFSEDGQYLRSNCGAYELLFCRPHTGQHIGSASGVRDVRWATHTCVLGWAVQGIWPAAADGTDVNAVDRSRTNGGLLLASGDDFGKVSVFRYPCVSATAECVSYGGHSSHVTNVRWAQDDRYLISLGGGDRSVLLWQLRDHSAERSGAGDGDREEEGEGEEDYSDGEGGGDDFDVMDEPSVKPGSGLAGAGFDFDAGGSVPGGGDEFMAVKPWLGAIVQPSVAPPVVSSAPEDELILEWAHGYRAADCRNNLRYSSSGCVVFHTAAVGVSMQATAAGGRGRGGGGRQQQFLQAHTDDILSFAMHPDGVHVATGQVGKAAGVQVWNCETMSLVGSLDAVHARAVLLLAFSPRAKAGGGRLLASVGGDDDHQLALHDWAAGQKRAGAKGDKGKTLALSFTPDGKGLVSCGVKHVRMWRVNGRNMSAKRAVIGKRGKLQTFLTLGWLGSTCVVGTLSGHLYLFEGAQLSRSVSAHQGPVDAMNALPGGRGEEGLITGSRNGSVVVWAANATKAAEFDLRQLHPDAFTPHIRSVCMADDGQRLLLGTRGSEVYELGWDGAEARVLHDGPLVSGHCKDEVWGLAVHPSRAEFCTVGDDHTLRVWDVEGHRLLRLRDLGGMARAVAYSPDGSLLAVGMGGRVGRGKQKQDGVVLVVRADSLETVHESRDSKQWISDVKFSPDGSLLAVGSHDTKVHLYDVRRKFAALRPFTKHNSYITHLDFSEDGQYLRSNCGAYELLFCRPHTGQHIGSASGVRDVRWATHTCVLGWAVQGIWPAAADGTDVNAVDRSRSRGSGPDAADGSGALLATGDDFGKVKLFRYPCAKEGARAAEFRGHSSHVTNVRWTTDDRYLISCGGNDRSVFQWRLLRDEPDSGEDEGAGAAEAVGAGAMGRSDDEEEGVLRQGVGGAGSRVGAGSSSTDSFDGGFDMTEGPGGGDEFMAVKPWLGAIKAPSNPPQENPRAPGQQLRLEWVHGYSAQTSRSNLFYTAGEDIVFHAAAVGVVMSPGSRTQRFHRGHSDDILCLAVSRDGRFVATGEIGKKPVIRVWDAESCELLCALPAFHHRGVSNLGFSADASQLASVGEDNDHTVAVWRDDKGSWAGAKLLASGKGDQNKVLFASWCGEGGGLVSGGVKHIKFWELKGKSLRAKKGKFGSKAKIQPLLCCAALGGTGGNGEEGVVSGAADGGLLLWRASSCVAVRAGAHTGAVYSVHSLQLHGRPLLASGGKDGCVRLWGSGLTPLACFDANADQDLGSDLPSASFCFNAAVRAVCLSQDGALLLVGTQGSEIFELEVKGSATEATASSPMSLQLHRRPPPLRRRSVSSSSSSRVRFKLGSSSSAQERRRRRVLSASTSTSGDGDGWQAGQTMDSVEDGGKRGEDEGEEGGDADEDAAMRPLLQAHCKDELWGLAPHPLDPALVATVGDDRSVRVWHADQHRLVRGPQRLPGMARAVAWSPDGALLAVGLGGDVGRGKSKANKTDGCVLLLDAVSLQELHRGKHAKRWISDVKFSPDGSLLAVGSHDTNIYVYSVEKAPPAAAAASTSASAPGPEPQLQLRGRCAAHNSYITHLDFSADGRKLQSNCGAYELLFFDVSSAAAASGSGVAPGGSAGVLPQLKSASALRNAEWASWTCTLGWPVQGIWPEAADGTDVNAVHRSNAAASGGGGLLATADDFGIVKLFRSPCVSKGSRFVVGPGHASHVTNVRFSLDDQRLFSSGGNDRCLFQWELLRS